MPDCIAVSIIFSAPYQYFLHHAHTTDIKPAKKDRGKTEILPIQVSIFSHGVSARLPSSTGDVEKDGEIRRRFDS